MAPGTSMVIADCVTGRQPHVDMAPYHIGRFNDRAYQKPTGMRLLPVVA